MLTEKEYILLCELASLDIPNLKLSNSLIFGSVSVFLFEDNYSKTFVVHVKNQQTGNTVIKEYQDKLADFISSNQGTAKCVVTGYELGGLYAAYVAAQLDIEAIVFKVFGTSELLGNVKNYIAENHAVGEFTEKVVFVKQKSMDENMNGPYSELLLFDEAGKVVIGEQSEYSKFTSWFYNTATNISGEIWRIFFNNTSEKDIFLDKEVYSIFLKVDELTPERIKISLKNTVIHMENQLEKNAKIMKLKFDKNVMKLEVTDFEQQILEVTEKTTTNAVNIIKDIYHSVETILMGLELFTFEKNSHDARTLMEEFSISVDGVLEKELQRITDFIKSQRQSYLDSLFVFSWS